MNQLTKVFNGNDIRMMEENSTLLFVASDVAKTLGYKEPHKAVTRHCKGEGMFRPVIDNLGRSQETRVIREPDVYRLVTNSKLPAAQDFENWVMEDVLPSIRQTGGYQLPQEMPFAELFRATATLLEQQQTQEVAVAELSQDVSYLKNSMRINTSEEYQIRKSVGTQVIKALGGRDSNAYQDKSIRSKAYAQFWSEFKRHFKMARYGDLAKRKLDDALEFITEWAPDTELRLMIKHSNQQLTIDEVG